MIVAITGEPLTGKSYIAKKIIAQSSSWLRKKYKNVRFLMNQSQKIIVLGHYTTEGITQGIDALPLNCENDIITFIRLFKKLHEEYRFLIEGNRISENLLRYIKINNEIIIINLNVEIENIYARRLGRKINYSEAYINDTRQKISEIKRKMIYLEMKNDTINDSSKIVKVINEKIWKTKIKKK